MVNGTEVSYHPPALRTREHIRNQTQFNFRWSTFTAPNWKPFLSFLSRAKREIEMYILIILEASISYMC